jgi:hypothetical protein
MDMPPLNPDESLILTLQDIVVSGVRTEVFVTSSRIILLESEKGQVRHEDILYEHITSVVTGENAFHEQTIALSLTPPSAEKMTVELVFFRRPGIDKGWERDQLVAKLKQHISPSLVQEHRTTPFPLRKAGSSEPDDRVSTNTGDAAAAIPATRPPAQDWVPRYSAYNSQSPPPADPSVRFRFNAITVIIIIIAVIGAGLIAAQVMKPKPSGPLSPAITPPVVANVSQNPATASPAPVLQKTSPEGAPLPTSPPQLLVPKFGVWVRLTSNGTYTGSVGTTRGGMKEVNTSGDQFYQISVRDGIVDVSVQKQEGSGDELAVAVYKEGVLVTRTNTTVPKGTVDLHANL